MKHPKLIVLGATALGLGVAAAGAYRATHPKDAGGPLSADPGRNRRPVPDELLDLPDGVTEHEIPTPDGGSVHVLEKGEGRPLVLLHGITLRADVWAPQFHQLADRYRVIAVDLRGHGSSRAGDDGFGIARLADDLATLLTELDLHHAVLVGHSMGGMTVMQFCGNHTDVLADRVDGLVFVATRAHQVFPPYLDRGARRLAARGQAMVDSGQVLPSRATVTTQAARLAFGDKPSPKAVQIVAEMGQSMVPESLMPSLSGLIEHDARDALRTTHTPSLVIVGTRDLLTPVPSARHLAHLLPASELVVLPRAGHQLMQERPDELAELVDAFVARLDGGAPTVARAVDADDRPVTSDQVEPG
ncbi:alpha/beta fold hydrolase [Aquihabitans daechungensis]|uniref:alpha/beta fold hydrolase n=1 Tax=Aquihabitans daechungensis TaxID=1052257 RepID=UPI003B9ED557